MFNGWTRRYSERALPKVVRAANAIVVGSAFSHDELIELLPVDESKVRVIPYGVGPPFTPEGPAADGDYVLAVSTLEPRKNFDRLVEGFRRSGFDGLELRVVGAEGWGGVGVDGDRDAGHQAALLDELQKTGVLVGHAGNAQSAPRRAIGERRDADLRQLSFRRGDRIAVRIDRRMAEQRVDPRQHLVADRVLQLFRLRVHL